MDQQLFDSRTGETILGRISEGMPVFDRDGHDVGKVAAVYLGAVSELEDQRGQGPATTPDPALPTDDTLLHHFAKGMTDDELPPSLRDRLLRSGFIRINTAGWFSSDRFAAPGQIAVVEDNEVTLSVTKEDLLKA
ncbi:MAG: hypothetical protein ACT4QE_19805 [Anaerolineales bacterium]